MKTKTVCPHCRSSLIHFDNMLGSYVCEKCKKSFDIPLEIEYDDEYDIHYINSAICEDPSISIRTVSVFLASSTFLKNERSAAATKAAELNGQDLSIYVNIYHCESDDEIQLNSSQQEEYFKKIDSSDVFLLMIDNDEIGDITLEELKSAVKKKSESNMKIAVFARSSSSGNIRKRKMWSDFLSENSDVFDLIEEYTTLNSIEECTKKLYKLISDDCTIGRVTEKCHRFRFNVLLMGTEEYRDENIYCLGDIFNTMNNGQVENDEKEAFIFNLIIPDSNADLSELPFDSISDYYFLIKSFNQNVNNLIYSLYEISDRNIHMEVNVDAGGGDEYTDELIAEISSGIKSNYLFKFSSIAELAGKNSLRNRINNVRNTFDMLQQGIVEYNKFDYYSALKKLQEVSDFGFKTAEFFIGNIYYDKSRNYYDIKKAIEHFRIAAANDPISQYNLAVTLAEDKQEKEAEYYYRLAADGGVHGALMNLGLLLYFQGRYPEAEEELKKAADSGITNALLSLAFLYNKIKNYDQAEKYYRFAIENKLYIALVPFGYLLEEQQRFSEAETYYRMAADENLGSQSMAAANNLSRLLMMQGKTEEARKYLLLASDSGNEFAQENLHNLEDFEKMFSGENTSSGIDKKAPEGLYKLAVILFEQNRIEEAALMLRNAAEAGYSVAQNDYALYLMERGNRQEAIKYLNIAAYFKFAEAQYNLACLLADSDINEAKKNLRLSAENGFHLAQYYYGLILEKRGEFAHAEKYYRDSADKGNRDAANALGIMLYNSGSANEAKSYFSLAAGKGSITAKCNLAVMLFENGFPDEAEKIFRQVADNDRPDILRDLGLVLYGKKQYKEAEQYLRLSADSGDAEAMASLGVLLYERNEKNESKEFLQKAADAGVPEAQFSLGCVFYESGMTDIALDYLNKAAKNGIHDAEMFLLNKNMA